MVIDIDSVANNWLEFFFDRMEEKEIQIITLGEDDAIVIDLSYPKEKKWYKIIEEFTTQKRLVEGTVVFYKINESEANSIADSNTVPEGVCVPANKVKKLKQLEEDYNKYIFAIGNPTGKSQ